jgi:hypothetical protein
MASNTYLVLIQSLVPRIYQRRVVPDLVVGQFVVVGRHRGWLAACTARRSEDAERWWLVDDELTEMQVKHGGWSL